MTSLPSPLSLKQAERVCDEYQHLVGKPLRARADLKEPVSLVLVAPWDELNKWIFIQHLNDTADAKEAMAFYKPPYYDVILIARFPDKDAYYYKDIRGYCAENQIDFDISKYISAGDPLIKWKPQGPDK